MKFKHIAMLFATLFLPACSNETTNDVQRLEAQRIENIDTPIQEQPIVPEEKPIKYNVDVINDEEEVKKVEEDFNITRDSANNMENTEMIAELQSSPTLLSTFSTKVYTKTNARMNNLNIVCDKISGVVIQPGEEFSYNTVAGPYDKAHGFGKATVLMGDGTEVQGYGGGVCQVSSTLYNAVKNCGVEITERHNHSKDVYYVPRNQDATVSYGNLDFKFKNLNDYPIQIQASANKQNVTVEIYKV
ncbi:MAG: VanW family protein [Clostridia bacterium]|nr:VanW family protein [Clostridia bacterium]